MQRGLTLTLRPGFLEDKQAALRSLIALYLRAGRTGCAFEAIERAKSTDSIAIMKEVHKMRDFATPAGPFTFDPRDGARPVKRWVEREVGGVLTERIVRDTGAALGTTLRSTRSASGGPRSPPATTH